MYNTKPIILATYVDNLLVFTTSLELVNNLNKDLTKSSKLEITDLKDNKEFLSIEIIRHRSKRSLIRT